MAEWSISTTDFLSAPVVPLNVAKKNVSWYHAQSTKIMLSLLIRCTSATSAMYKKSPPLPLQA